MQHDRSDRDPAPALGRGLAILDYLALNGASSLERLCADLQLPKSSGLRILESLQLAGAVSRDPQSKRFRALLKLGPVAMADGAMQRAAAEFCLAAAEAQACVVELYALHDGIPFMVDRAVPETQSDHLQARIGFQRDLREIEAIAQVAIAFGPAAQPADDCWRWGVDGQREAQSPAATRRLIERARRSRLGIDRHPNEGGVRRYTAPIIDADQTLRGIVAFAETAADRHIDEAIAEACQACAASISAALLAGQPP